GAGAVIGLTGLVGLTLGGHLADRVHQRFERGRLMMAGACLAGSAAATWLALAIADGDAGLFVVLFGAGWLLQYVFYVCVYPAVQDVVEPRLRATAMSVMVVVAALLGGALGPLLVG